MDTHQIETILATDPIVRPYLRGVLASDQLPRQARGAFVINTDPHDRPGEHWVACYIDETGDYFDSYGLPPWLLPITNFMNRNTIRWDTNTEILQSPFSDTCGHYCIYFLWHRCRGMSLRDIVATFTHDLQNNDALVRHFVEHLSTDVSCRGGQSCVVKSI